MRKKFSDNKFFMPKQYELGTPEKEATDAIETPTPLSKGYDGLPKFNELNQAQKRNMPKAMRSQVAYQQKKLQYSNYQIVNFRIKPDASASTQDYFYQTYNVATAVGTALTDGVLFGSATKDSDKAKYYNIVYASARWSFINTTSTNFLLTPSLIEFYLLQKVGGGVFGGKIPRQIEAVKDETNLSSLTVNGTEYGNQQFGIDVLNPGVYYTPTNSMVGMRCCGVALKEINLNFQNAIALSDVGLDIELGIDLKTAGNNY